jgi:transposase
VNKVTTVGIDLAKSVFQIHGVDGNGLVRLRKQVRRAQLLQTMAQVPACLIGIESCGSAQYWRRELEKLGHTVRMMSPQYVKPYVKSQKNDKTDAEAICEAVSRPNMRFVLPKSLEQQDLQTAHRVRQGLMGERTALINRLRGLLGEYGVVLAPRPATVRRELPDLLTGSQTMLTSVARELLSDLYEHFQNIELRLARTEAVIERLGDSNEIVKRLRTVPGIGLLTSTALVAAIGDGKGFKSGRHLAAWLGLVPRQNSSGGKQQLLGITKRGDKYLRCLLIHGGRALTTNAERYRTTGWTWLNAVRDRRGKHRAYVAQANKNARIAWAVMTKGENYRAPAAA